MLENRPTDRDLIIDRSIILTGMMGAGKSSIGRRLGQRLNLPFVDADAEIEAAAGCTIEEIFTRHGEPSFRDGERRVIARLIDGPLAVIGTGGGAFMDAETRALIHRNCISVWLKADLETLVARVSRRTHRPLLKSGEPRQILARLMAIRHPFYAEADVTVETGDVPASATVERVIEALRDHLAERSRVEARS